MIAFTHRITAFPDGAQSFLEVPFEVGADIERIEVSYAFPTGARGSVVDIGLAHEGLMRGWTGSEYGHVWIAEDRAAAGYRAGPLAGRWQVVLGIVRLGEEAWVDLSIRLVPRRARWFAGDLHSHTEHSDGGLPVTEALRRAAASGCDFLALTDHNAVSQNHVQPEDGTVLRLPGMELTTYWGHTNFLGLTAPVADWRCRSVGDVVAKMAEARAAGATIVINHPCSDAGFNRWRPGWEVPFDALEIWNGTWAAHNVEAVALWQSLLVEGRRIPATGGSDFHLKNRRRHGRPANRLWADSQSVAGLLRAVRAGANVVCAAPDETRAEPAAGTPMFGAVTTAGAPLGIVFDGLAKGDDIRIVTDAGVVRSIRAEAPRQEIEMPLAGRFLRAEVWAGAEPRLFTNPIYGD
jgi:hypothetical protein